MLEWHVGIARLKGASLPDVWIHEVYASAVAAPTSNVPNTPVPRIQHLAPHTVPGKPYPLTTTPLCGYGHAAGGMCGSRIAALLFGALGLPGDRGRFSACPCIESLAIDCRFPPLTSLLPVIFMFIISFAALKIRLPVRPTSSHRAGRAAAC